MTREEHLLVTLSEECSEVAKEACKALRFGLDDKEPGQDKTNRDKIAAEFNDLFAVILMLEDEGVFKGEKIVTPDTITKKQQKVEKYLKYSKSVGK